jgi:hypothetical protein
MALEIRNQFGQLSVAAIDPAEVAKLSDDQQAKLATLITAVENREAAADRFNKAVLGVRLATTEQEEALAAHHAANPPLSFQDAQRAAIDAFNNSH